MPGQWVYPILIGSLLVVLLAIALPGHRSAPDMPALATVSWQSSASGGTQSFEQAADLATCRQAQRQIAYGGDPTIGRITVECRARHRSGDATMPGAARLRAEQPPAAQETGSP